MAVSTDPTSAQVQTSMVDTCLRIELSGRWRITDPRPSLLATVEGVVPGELSLGMSGVTYWDSSVMLFALEAQRWARAQGILCDLSEMPATVQHFVAKLDAPAPTVIPAHLRPPDIFSAVGMATVNLWREKRANTAFVGECVLALVRMVRQPRAFRWRECLEEMQQCGAMALPIVGLISLLVGLIMAYQAAVQLRQFGADIYVADLVGLAVVREMGPMMAAVIIAGRTGAAFAATIANMKAGEEIDALETLAINPVDFLVLPRLLALAVMMPLLALYSDLLGIVGGMLVAKSVLEIPPTAYWVEMQTIVDLSDVSTGLIKSAAFGLLIGLSGCLRGLQAHRSAAGVGLAATSAVVTSILLIIVADALFAVVFNILGI